VRDMGLNTIRSEGKMETEDFFKLADEQGVLVMIGWTCCDRYERWTNWTPENQQVAVASLHSQILRLRGHASVLVWLNGSDNPPTAAIEPLYLQEEADLHWPNPTLSSATARKTTVSGESGVKMNGPYDFVAPAYWEIDTKNGGAWGFSTEIGPGPAIPTLDSMRKFLPEADIWPHDDAWRYHAGGGGFKDATVFNKAMDAIYGPTQTAVDYDRIAQAMAYDGERAMFEAYSRNKYHATGVIQWMLNNSWPSMIWHLYDYYLGTGGGYFGTKKADEPLHIQYSYDDGSIVVVNSTYVSVAGLHATVHVHNLAWKELYSSDATLDSALDSAQRVFTIPESLYSGPDRTLFVDLTLSDAAGHLVSRNFYWVPVTLTTFDWARTDYTHTPAARHEDLTALASLPPAKLDARAEIETTPRGRELRLHLGNQSTALAFQVRGAVRTQTGGLIAPVFWSDNWIEIEPGESRVLTALLPEGVVSEPVVQIEGWNVAAQTITPNASSGNGKGN